MLKLLVIIDDATHESVAIVPEHTIGGESPDTHPGWDLLAAWQAGSSSARTTARSSRARRC